MECIQVLKKMKLPQGGKKTPEFFSISINFIHFRITLKRKQFSHTCWVESYQLGKLIKDEFWIKKASSFAEEQDFSCRSWVWQRAYQAPLSICIFPPGLRGNEEGVPEMKCKSNILDIETPCLDMESKGEDWLRKLE